MASSHVQKQCEIWIVQHWLPKKLGVMFSTRKLQLQDRGYFEFDAVSAEGDVVANISTASAFTHRCTVSAGNKSKIRADCLMLSLVKAKRRMLLLTELSMFQLSSKEQLAGRLPLDIEIFLVELPGEMRAELEQARGVASREVRGAGPSIRIRSAAIPETPEP
jgi:hypothetical protein